jgi:hypothetical protein
MTKKKDVNSKKMIELKVEAVLEIDRKDKATTPNSHYNGFGH